MKLKRKIIAAALAASTMLLCSADAFAGVNFGNGDGSDFKHGTGFLKRTTAAISMMDLMPTLRHCA